MKLNRTGSRWDRSQRININDNWDEIERKYFPLLNLGKEAESTLKKALEINAEAQKTNNMNESVQQQINTLIAESGTSDAEVLQARVDVEGNEYPVLKDRLDHHEKITEENRKKVYTKSTNKTKPLVSFYLDDGYQADYDVVLPKSSSLNIPLTISVYNNSPLANTPERLEELVNTHGWELHGHSDDGLSMTDKTLTEQKAAMKRNNDFYKDLGFELKGICYPIGHRNKDLLEASREFYEVGMSSSAGVNYSPIDTYDIKRYLTDYDLTGIKEQVDKIKREGTGWIVLYSHAGQFDADPDKKTHFFEMMDYVHDSGIETVTVDTALKKYANTLDIGDKNFSIDFAKIGSDGNSEITNMPITVDKNNENVNDREGTDFKAGFISINKFRSSSPSDIPHNNGVGTLYTHRTFEQIGAVGSVAIQEFLDTFGRRYSRRYSSSTGWDPWTASGILNNERTTNYTNDSPATEFPSNKITVTEFLSSHNSGLPEGGIGTLITNRSASTYTIFQVYYPNNNNNFYKRYWSGDSWSDWSSFTETIKHRETFDFGTLTSGQNKTYDFTVEGTNTNMNPVVNFTYGIADGVVPFAYMGGANKVVVKLVNTKQNEVTVGSRPISFSVQ